MEVTGIPEFVIVSGRVCVDEGGLKAVHGFGKYINTDPFGAYVYDMIKDQEKVSKGVIFLIIVWNKN